MDYKILLLIAMIFFHIIDDYYLQGFLARAKQKSWWEQNYPDKLYKYDYIMALVEHAFSWAVMINIPAIIYVLICGITFPTLLFIDLFIANIIAHAYVDNVKANLLKINLSIDQLIHIFQIILTWLLYVFF